MSADEPLADAWRLRHLLARREVSSRELVRRCLERIERLDGGLRAFRVVTEARALADADAADRALREGDERGLLGVPVAVKDVVDVAGETTSLGTGAVTRPDLVSEVTERFGSQVLVVSVDARRNPAAASGFEVTSHGGRRSTGRDAVAWVAEVCGRGAGEVLLNSMDADGTGTGFDLPMIAAVRAVCPVPLVASGGAGLPAHFTAAVAAGADAVLAAGVFHDGHLELREVKQALQRAGHCVRVPRAVRVR